MLRQGLLLGLLESWAVTQAVRGPAPPMPHGWALDARVLGNQASCFESRVSSVAGAYPRVYVCVLRSPQETRAEPEEQGQQGMRAEHVGYAGRPQALPSLLGVCCHISPSTQILSLLFLLYPQI